MISKEERRALAEMLGDYLRTTRGLENPARKHFCCPFHADKRPSMTLAPSGTYCRCWAEEESYDIFDFARVDYGAQTFPEQVRCVKQVLGIVDGNDFNRTENNERAERKRKAEEEERRRKDEAWSRKLIPASQRQFAGSESEAYMMSRGISRRVCNEWGLGHATVPTVLKDGTYGHMTGVVIPRDDNGGYMLRNIHIKADTHDADRGDKCRRKGERWACKAWRLYSAPAVVIVEGEIDAMSIDEGGGRGIAIGGASDTWLEDYIRKNGRPSAGIVIAMDNDGAGREASKKLKDMFDSMGINVFVDDVLYGKCKDANEALLYDRFFRVHLGEAQEVARMIM